MSYTLVLEWMPGDLYMSAVTARCTAPTSSYSVVWLPPNKVYQITLYCGSTSLVSFLVGAFRGKAWSYMRTCASSMRTKPFAKGAMTACGLSAPPTSNRMYSTCTAGRTAFTSSGRRKIPGGKHPKKKPCPWQTCGGAKTDPPFCRGAERKSYAKT